MLLLLLLLLLKQLHIQHTRISAIATTTAAATATVRTLSFYLRCMNFGLVGVVCFVLGVTATTPHLPPTASLSCHDHTHHACTHTDTHHRRENDALREQMQHARVSGCNILDLQYAYKCYYVTGLQHTVQIQQIQARPHTHEFS